MTVTQLRTCDVQSGYTLADLVRCGKPASVRFESNEREYWMCEECATVFSAGSGVDDTADGVPLSAVARSGSAVVSAETSEQSPPDPGRSA